MDKSPRFETNIVTSMDGHTFHAVSEALTNEVRIHKANIKGDTSNRNFAESHDDLPVLSIEDSDRKTTDSDTRANPQDSKSYQTLSTGDRLTRSQWDETLHMTDGSMLSIAKGGCVSLTTKEPTTIVTLPAPAGTDLLPTTAIGFGNGDIITYDASGIKSLARNGHEVVFLEAQFPRESANKNKQNGADSRNATLEHPSRAPVDHFPGGAPKSDIWPISLVGKPISNIANPGPSRHTADVDYLPHNSPIFSEVDQRIGNSGGMVIQNLKK